MRYLRLVHICETDFVVSKLTQWGSLIPIGVT
jgi:hypothetical protein